MDSDGKLHTQAHALMHAHTQACMQLMIDREHYQSDPLGRCDTDMLQWRRWTNQCKQLCVFVCFLTVSESWGLRSTLRKRNAKTGTMHIAVASVIVNHTTGCNNVLWALPVLTNTHITHTHIHNHEQICFRNLESFTEKQGHQPSSHMIWQVTPAVPLKYMTTWLISIRCVKQ